MISGLVLRFTLSALMRRCGTRPLPHHHHHQLLLLLLLLLVVVVLATASNAACSLAFLLHHIPGEHLGRLRARGEDKMEGTESLLRRRRIDKLGTTDADQFVVDEVAEEKRLPSLSELSAKKNSDNEGFTSSDLVSEDEVDDAVVSSLLRSLRKTSSEQPSSVSSDWFDYGFGRIVKSSVYFCILAAILWEVYLNSPFFERHMPLAPIVF
jgi:hypothetical protein